MKGKRKSFSHNEKRILLEAYEQMPKTSQRDAAAQLGVPQASLCSLLKQRETIMASSDGDRKRRRTGKAPLVEAAILQWIEHASVRNAPLSGPLVREKAGELAAILGEDNFKVSAGWFDRFKKRENIVFKNLHGETAEVEVSLLEEQFGQMKREYTIQRDMSSLWQQEPPSYSPCVEIDSSTMRRKNRVSSQSQHWLKQEHNDLEVIKWETMTSGVTSDVEQDNTPSSAVSTASQPEGLPPRVMMTITKLQCMLESKQERIAALERQVEDLLQDRKFLRTQIENLTSTRPFSTFTSSPLADAPKASKPVCSEPKPRKRERGSSSSSLSNDSGSEMSVSTVMSGASNENKKRRHHKERRRGKKGKDYSRKRATGVQYVIHRYKQVLSAFIKKKSMSGAFRHYGIDRNTIANTAPIAELHLAAKDTLALVGMFRPREETLVSYAQKCALVIETDVALARKIEQMKANGELLPITVKKSRLMHSVHQPLGVATESMLLV